MSPHTPATGPYARRLSELFSQDFLTSSKHGQNTPSQQCEHTRDVSRTRLPRSRTRVTRKKGTSKLLSQLRSTPACVCHARTRNASRQQAVFDSWQYLLLRFLGHPRFGQCVQGRRATRPYDPALTTILQPLPPTSRFVSPFQARCEGPCDVASGMLHHPTHGT